MNLRLARNKDSEQIIKLIRKCFKVYQNCLLDVDNASPELKYIYTYFRRQRGKFWVIENKNKIIGCMGYLPSKKNEIEIHKLYIDQKFRRKGLAKHLVQKVENIAMRENKSKVILWTDTRFKEAHKMYLKMDYEKSKKTRRLYDISDCLLYTSPSPRDGLLSRMPSSA